MERAIHKREDIAVKYTATKKSNVVTKATVKKDLTEIKKKLKMTTAESKTLEEEITRLVAEQEAIADELEDITAECNEIRAREDEIEAQVEMTELEKRKNREALVRSKRQLQRYDAARKGEYELTVAKEDLDDELASVAETQLRVREVLRALGKSFPHIRPELDAIAVVAADE